MKRKEYFLQWIFFQSHGIHSVYIDGGRLGLGTNLFSDKHTLLEEYNYSYVNTELNKNSRFYNNCFINNDC